MVSHGFIPEVPSLVGIYFTCTLHSLKGKSIHAPTDLSGNHVHHALLLQPAGVCDFRSFWVSRPSNRGLETHEMVQPLTGPADPGGDAAAGYQRANPTTPSMDRLLFWVVCWVNRSPEPICL